MTQQLQYKVFIQRIKKIVIQRGTCTPIFVIVNKVAWKIHHVYNFIKSKNVDLLWNEELNEICYIIHKNKTPTLNIILLLLITFFKPSHFITYILFLRYQRKNHWNIWIFENIKYHSLEKYPNDVFSANYANSLCYCFKFELNIHKSPV